MPGHMPPPPHERLEPLRRIARTLPGGMALGRWLRQLANPDLRAIAAVQRSHADRLFQPFPETQEDRYPELFDALAERLSAIAEPRILSFGCSSGAEVRALRRRIPQARITGIDANPRMIAKARKADPVSRYILADSVDPVERFDVILAMAVFRHGELEALRPDTCTATLPFTRFAEGVAMLDACLEPGGWLAIWNAHYRFGDTDVAAGYAADGLRMQGGGQELFYGADDRRIDGQCYDEVLFRKADSPSP